MSLGRSVWLGALSISLWTSALAIIPTIRASEAPAAPSMPDGWKVVSDESFSSDDVEAVARRLGGDVAALRNTLYNVHGKQVQLNLIVAANETSATKIVETLHDMKPKEFVLHRGFRIYEFVGKNEAMPEMRAGRAHLERSHAPGVSREDRPRR